MKNKIKISAFAAFTILMVTYGCENDSDNPIISEPDEITIPGENSSVKPPSSSSVLGTKLYDFAGGERSNGVSFSIGSKIYLGFGVNNSGQAKDLWEWDFDKIYTDWDWSYNHWERLPDFPGSFTKNRMTESTSMGFAVNGKGYILPGAFFDEGKLVNEFWEFNPETNGWSRKADPPVTLARFSATGFSIGTKLFIGTGESYLENEWKLFNDFWEWDQTTDTWSKRADFPGEARAHATGFSIGNKGYLGLGGVIGMGGGPLYYDFWEYDPETDFWTRKANFQGEQLIGATGFSIRNKGYVAAGWDPLSESTTTQDIWEYNQKTDLWSHTGVFAGGPRTGAAGGSIGSWGYLLTGQKLSGDFETFPMFSDFWLLNDLPSDVVP